MRSTVNGAGVNSTALPDWVVRAVVAATVAATFAVDGTRVVQARVFADASVAVTLTQQHVIAARANALATASSFAEQTFVYAGTVNAQAAATGNAAVRRDIYGRAGGDASAYASAFVGAIGEASAVMAATVESCDAHIIFPGRAFTACAADFDPIGGDVTRYALVSSVLGGVEYTRAEASFQQSGDDFWRHDGYVLGATASCTSLVPQDRNAVIVTLGTFDFGDSTAEAKAFMRQPASALRYGTATADPIASTYRLAAKTESFGNATSTASADRIHMAAVVDHSTAVSYAPVARIKYATSALANAAVVAYPVASLRRAYARANSAATSYLVQTQFGTQHTSTATSTATAIGSPVEGLYSYAASATGNGTVTLVSSVFGYQQRADVKAVAVANDVFAFALHNHSAVASGYAVSSLTSAEIREQTRSECLPASAVATAEVAGPLQEHQGHVEVSAAATGFASYAQQYYATGFGSAQSVSSAEFAKQRRGSVSAIATANHNVNTVMFLVGTAFGYTSATWFANGVTNCDVKAPGTRYIIVPYELRAMPVVVDDRLMRIAA